MIDKKKQNPISEDDCHVKKRGNHLKNMKKKAKEIKKILKKKTTSFNMKHLKEEEMVKMESIHREIDVNLKDNDSEYSTID